jgi:hypothetical protein
MIDLGPEHLDFLVVLLLDATGAQSGNLYVIDGNMRSFIREPGHEVFRDDFPVLGVKPDKRLCLHALGSIVASTWVEHFVESLGLPRGAVGNH